MPATNKNKVQQQLTLSKHVKNESKLSNSVAALPLVSGIPRRSRAQVVLNDELLLQIKKGLELSVNSKSKVKVKRLSGGIKALNSKDAISKQSPAPRGRRKKALVRVDEMDSTEVNDSPKMTLNSDKSQLSVELGSVRQLNDNLSGSPTRTPNVAPRSRTKNTVIENIQISRLSPRNETVLEKPLEVSKAYNLRSRSDVPLSIVTQPFNSKKLEANEAENNSISPGLFYSVPAPDLKADVILKGSVKKRKGSESGLPKSKMRRSVSGLQDSWTDLKSSNGESRSSVAFSTNIERFETPRQTSRKRKSVIGIGNELHLISEKASSLAAPLTPRFSTVAHSRDTEPWVAVTRVSNAEVQRSSGSDLAISKLFSYTPKVHAKKVESLSNDIHETSSKKPKTDDDAQNVVFKTPGPPLSDVLVNSVAKRRLSVRGQSAAKIPLMENGHPKSRPTRSLHSKVDVDSSNFKVTESFNEAKTNEPSNTLGPQSISESSSESYTNDSNPALDEGLEAFSEQKSRQHARLCQSLFLISLPVAVAAYAYCFGFGELSE